MTQEKIVALGRAKTDPDPRIVEELERFLKLAKQGRITTLVMSAEVPDPDDWEQDEIRSRWFEAHKPGSADMVRMVGVAQNLANSVGMNLWNMGYAPTEENDPDDG